MTSELCADLADVLIRGGWIEDDDLTTAQLIALDLAPTVRAFAARQLRTISNRCAADPVAIRLRLIATAEALEAGPLYEGQPQ